MKAVVLLVCVLLIVPASSEDNFSPSVGMAGRIEQLVLPGSELIAKPLDDDSSPIVLRVEAVFPHGTSNRYDLEFYGLEPGKFDLRDYLLRKNGSDTSDLPAIPVEIRGILGPGQIQPNTLTQSELPGLGGYRSLLGTGGILWIIGLLALLFLGKKKRLEDGESGAKNPSLADRLRPIVEHAQTGKLSINEQAELERLLIGYWRGRLNLEGQSMTAAIKTLRQHDEAGALLSALEQWLHSPDHGAGLDVAQLLSPYENVSVEP
ncbi:MAG: hypothetical protein ACI9R3_002900 [Verrucomicrobiales bacterium]|jgi:hypothetical protein